MRTQLVQTFPGFVAFGKEVLPPKHEWRAMLSKAELATLRKAQKILEELRERVEDPTYFWEEYRSLCMAEAGLSEMLLDGQLEHGVVLSDYATQQGA